ncbi:MAG TPA: hypothetical protein PLZ84_06890, partial [Clostridia bacterium]|nr:hypothetical protein [Clostridia bacterium]
DLTLAAVKDFQKANGIPDTGTVANMTYSVLYTTDAKRKDVTQDTYDEKLGRDGKPDPTPPPPKTGEMLDWFKVVDKLIPRGTVFKVTDFYTGISWNMIRTGGYNHADSETLTAADTTQMRKVYKSWSWTRRPVLVTVNGRVIAASIHGMPHAFDRNNNANNMNGHVCVHFLNSKTHIRNLKDSAHQRCVRIAAGLA